MLTRRTFLSRTGAVAAAAALAPVASLRAALQDHPFRVIEIGDGAWMIGEGGGNVLLLASDAGPVIVDSKVATMGRALRSAAEQVAGRAPVVLINTHHHADHIGGNFAFSADAKVIAHKNVRARLAQTIEDRVQPSLRQQGDQVASTLELEDFVADTEIDREQRRDHGGRRIVLRHFGPGHTDNDLIVHLPEANILHTGDLVFHELHPYIDVAAGATTVGWEKSLAGMIEMIDDETKVIPGHGALTDVSGLRKQVQYFQVMRAFVQGRLAAGDDRLAVVASPAEQLPEAVQAYGFGQMRERVLGALFDELAGG